MRMLVLVSILSLVLYVVTLPACQYMDLRRVTGAAEGGRFDEAWIRLLPMFQEKPAFFLDRVKTLCGQLSLQQARSLATQAEPSSVGAVARPARIGRGTLRRFLSLRHFLPGG
jgi:hypothetical protein